MTSDTPGTSGLRHKLGRLFGSTARAVRVPNVDDDDLHVIVRSDDDATASSTVLEAAGFDSDRKVVLRHLLELPETALDDAAASAALEGYSEGEVLPDDPAPSDGGLLLALVRVQSVDARTVSQERSRIASLASRSGGRGLGWALLDVPVASSTGTRR
ncbi:ribonuclease E inhibitor RraB [Gordonia malaquae]|uniref:ribonuclease E inhibitor RraB n=1 Tax=Gordonia malaquae TaxID=410332 RepID=UPI003018BD30